MCLSLFSVIFLCITLPSVRTSGAYIDMRTLKTGTYSHQVDGRHRQKDTCALTSTRDGILYLLGPNTALTQRWQCQQKNRAVSNINAVASNAGDPQRTPSIQEYGILKEPEYLSQPGLIEGEGGLVPRYICSSWKRELRTCCSKGICFSTLDNICKLIVTWKEDLTA